MGPPKWCSSAYDFTLLNRSHTKKGGKLHISLEIGFYAQLYGKLTFKLPEHRILTDPISLCNSIRCPNVASRDSISCRIDWSLDTNHWPSIRRTVGVQCMVYSANTIDFSLQGNSL